MPQHPPVAEEQLGPPLLLEQLEGRQPKRRLEEPETIRHDPDRPTLPPCSLRGEHPVQGRQLILRRLDPEPLWTRHPGPGQQGLGDVHIVRRDKAHGPRWGNGKGLHRGSARDEAQGRGKRAWVLCEPLDHFPSGLTECRGNTVLIG